MAKERDFAMQEMKTMTEQCRLVADEFEGLAKQYEALNRQLLEVQDTVIIILYRRLYYLRLARKEILQYRPVRVHLKLMSFSKSKWS